MDQHVAVLARNGERDLPLEIEMLLPADTQSALRAMGALGKRSRAVVLAERVVRQDVAVGRKRLIDGNTMRAR